MQNSFPHIQQPDAMECGATCLRMIAKYYGKEYTGKNLNLIYLILIGQLMLVLSRASVDFIRRWILLHISTRVNISLLSDFLIKLMRLPMAFFDTKMVGDLLQRINDHERVERFLTAQTLTVLFSAFSFVVFGGVLLYYNLIIFLIFFFRKRLICCLGVSLPEKTAPAGLYLF